MKKLKPRARGCSYPIKRPIFHITIRLKDIYVKKVLRRAGPVHNA